MEKLRWTTMTRLSAALTSFHIFCSVTITFHCSGSPESLVPLRSAFRESEFKKQIVDKLFRWASKLQEIRYIIEHLHGENNLWRDMLSRWISKPSEATTMALGAPIRALHDKHFSWPSVFEIQQCQEQPSPYLWWSPDVHEQAVGPRWATWALKSVSWVTVTSLVTYLSRESKEEFQSVFCGNYSKRTSNASVVVSCIVESMTSHFFLDLWDKHYMELHRTKLFITTF